MTNIEKLPYLKFAEGLARTRSTCASSARRSAATCRSAGAASTRCRCRHCPPSTPCSRPPAKAARSPPPWPSCASSTSLLQGQGDRQTRRAHRARRVAHLRHGRHVPPDRHLEPAGPELRAAGRRPVDVLQGIQGRPDPPGRHQRSRRHGRLDRRRHVVLDARRADDSVLHLLLDVRPAAHHGPGLGGGRLSARAASWSAAPPAAPR